MSRPNTEQQTHDTTEFLTVAQVCARLNLSEKTVRKRITAGEIPAEKTALARGGFAFKIPAQWVENQTGTEERPEPERKHPENGTEAERKKNDRNGSGTELFETGTEDLPQSERKRPESGTESPGTQKEVELLRAQAEQNREEIQFLRALVESLSQSEAQTKAALREALKAMPKQLNAAPDSMPDDPPKMAQNYAPTMPTATSATPTREAVKSAQIAPQSKQPRPMWKVVLGIRK